MTRAQKEWLDNNKRFQMIGQRLGPGDKIAERGMLHPDGTFEKLAFGQRPATVRAGSFEVVAIQRGTGAGANPLPGVRS